MNKERLNDLWSKVNSVIKLNSLEYGCAVTLGSVFGEMQAEIEKLNAEKNFK